jgi:hypothetical protein
VVIGATKSGTTSLDRYLDQHPQIYMSPVKEPQYFLPIRSLKTTIADFDEYRALFDGVRDELAIGEVSPFYITSTPAADRIKETLPGVRLVAILRNPVERAFSDYAMLIEKGREHLSFEDAVDDEIANPVPKREEKKRNNLKHGLYGQQLAAYYERFDRDHIEVVLFEDMRADAPAVLRRLYGFLGVDADFVPDTSRVYNATSAPPRHPRLNRLVRRAQNHGLQRLAPRSLRTRVRTLTAQDADEKLELDPATRARLVEYYRPDVRILEELLGRDLSTWLA